MRLASAILSQRNPSRTAKMTMPDIAAKRIAGQLSVAQWVGPLRRSNGFSMRLDGLMETNSNARMRAVVMHGSDYVHDNDSGICGRSWGCPSMDYKIVREVIAKLRDGSLLYSHYKGKFQYEK